MSTMGSMSPTFGSYKKPGRSARPAVGGPPHVSRSPAPLAASPSASSQSNMYLRLTQDAPQLTGELRATLDKILEATNSMGASHIDTIGLAGAGIRWWKVAPDFGKRLYFECFNLCTLSQEYRTMAPAEVQAMVAALEASSLTIQTRMAEISLIEAITEDKTGLFSKFSQSTAFSTAVVASIMRHRDSVPIDLAQLYPANHPWFRRRPNTIPSTQSLKVQAASQEARDVTGGEDESIMSEDEENMDSNSESSIASSSDDSGSDENGPVFPAKRLKRSRIDDIISDNDDDNDSDYEELVRPSNRLRRPEVPTKGPGSQEDEESDSEPVRPSNRLGRSRVPARSAQSHEDVETDDDEPIRPPRRLGRSKVAARSAISQGDANTNNKPLLPSRRLKRSRAPAQSQEDEESEEVEPARSSKRLKRSKISAKGQKSNEDAESSEDDEPSGKLAPGKKNSRWSNGSLRASRTIRGINDRDLPATALNGPVHELESNCTHPNVNIRYCDFDLSIEEILTYFPLHTSWREVCWRVVHHWPALQVIEFLYWTRDLRGDKTAGRSTLQCRYKAARKWAKDALRKLQEEQAKASGPAVVSSTSTLAKDTGPALKSSMDAIALEHGNRGRDGGAPIDYYISDLSEGVHHNRRPTGKGAQLLTRVIEHAASAGKIDLRLSEVSHYARKHSISVPHADRFSNGIAAEDEAALVRHRNTIKKFYLDRFNHAPR